MPLTMVDTGAANTVKQIRGKDDTRHFLASLGFTEGATVTVVCSLAGNLIVQIKDSRIALSQQMASRILV